MAAKKNVGLGGVAKAIGKVTAPGQVKPAGGRAIGKAIGKATAPGQLKKLVRRKKKKMGL